MSIAHSPHSPRRQSDSVCTPCSSSTSSRLRSAGTSKRRPWRGSSTQKGSASSRPLLPKVSKRRSASGRPAALPGRARGVEQAAAGRTAPTGRRAAARRSRRRGRCAGRRRCTSSAAARPAARARHRGRSARRHGAPRSSMRRRRALARQQQRHAEDRRDADAAGHQQRMRRLEAELEVVVRLADQQLVAGLAAATASASRRGPARRGARRCGRPRRRPARRAGRPASTSGSRRGRRPARARSGGCPRSTAGRRLRGGSRTRARSALRSRCARMVAGCHCRLLRMSGFCVSVTWRRRIRLAPGHLQPGPVVGQRLAQVGMGDARVLAHQASARAPSRRSMASSTRGAAPAPPPACRAHRARWPAPARSRWATRRAASWRARAGAAHHVAAGHLGQQRVEAAVLLHVAAERVLAQAGRGQQRVDALRGSRAPRPAAPR